MYKWWIFYSYMYIYSQELAYRPVHPFDDTYKLTCPRSECMKPHSSVIQNSEDKLFRPQVCTAVPTFYKIMKYKIEGKGLEKISVDLFSYSLYKFIFIFRVILIYRYWWRKSGFSIGPNLGTLSRSWFSVTNRYSAFLHQVKEKAR